MALADPLLPEGDGHTPLSEDEIDGLIPTYITTRGELNAAEQDNVAHALTLAAPSKPDQILDPLYLRRLHEQMFGDVWAWAGQYRRREMNIGIDPARIPMAVVDLCGDAKHWIKVTGEEDLAAARFHHRLVSVHPFRNGNGRHARRAADLLLNSAGLDAFTWGANADLRPGDLRARYLAALRKAPLPAGSGPLQRYEVLKPLDVQAGVVTPAFGQPGMGIQYMSSQTVADLIAAGSLKAVG